MERELIAVAQRGDDEAFVRLIDGRIDRLFTVAQRILRDGAPAQDALQEALVIAWRDLRALKDPDRFDAWLNRLLVRVCIAEARRERRRVTPLLSASLNPKLGNGPPAPDEYATVDDRDQLERGFRRLTAEQRAILVLRHFLGYSSTEIAETLGIPSGTARSRLFNAHRAMRAALDADARRAVAGG